jgi:hypothetical protein
LMSFPPGTEMFQFPGFASHAYEFSTGSPCGGVSPFGHPRINDRSHLPAAFRSVPRPSSPLGAKASTERPSLTHHHLTPQPARSTKPRTKSKAKQQQAYAHSHISIHQIHLSKSCPGREHVSPEGVSWKRPRPGHHVPPQASPTPAAAPRGGAEGHRERRAEPVSWLGSLEGMAATRRHPPSASRHFP